MDGDLAISTDGYGDGPLTDDLPAPTSALAPVASEAAAAVLEQGPPGDPVAPEGVPAIVFASAPADGGVEAAGSDAANPEMDEPVPAGMASAEVAAEVVSSDGDPLATAAAAPLDEAAAPGEDLARLESLLESLLLAAGSPVALARLVEVLDGPARRDVVAALRALGERYEREGRGLRLVHVAGGWQLRSAPEHGPFVRKLLGGRPPRLSRAMLETLAIVAYRQPCTKPEIEAIRGVDADATLNTLLERRMVRITGRKDAPGRPLLYATTREFLEVFGLPDLQALPPLAELGSGADVLVTPDLTVSPAGVHPTPAAALGFVANGAGAHDEPPTPDAGIVAPAPRGAVAGEAVTLAATVPGDAPERPPTAEPSAAECGPDGDGTAG